jgi:hypothetical protein
MNSAKIKPYKFLNPSVTKKDGISPRAILAVNRIGLTMQTQGMYLEKVRTLFEFQNKFLNDSLKKSEAAAARKRDKEAEATQEGLDKVDAKTDVKEEDKKKSKTWIDKILGFLKPFEGIISFLVRAFVIKNVLNWVGNPQNTKKVQNTVESLAKFFKFIYKAVSFGIGNTMDGITKVFGGIEKIKRGDFGGLKDGLNGVGQLLVGIGALKAVSYLLNPFSLITDIMGLLDKIDGNTPKEPTGKPNKPTSRPTVGNIDAKGSRIKPGDYVDTKTGRIVKKETLDRLEQRYGGNAAKRVVQATGRNAVSRAARNTTAAALKGSRRLIGSTATKIIGKSLGRIPFIGGLIDFAFNLMMGEPLGKAAAKAVGSTLGAGLGAVVGSLIPGPGTFIGGLLGGIVGDWIAGSIYDWLTKNKGAAAKETEGLTPGAASGGIVNGAQMTLVGEGGEPEVIIPLSKLGLISQVTTIPGIIGASLITLDRMGAIGNMIMPFIGGDIRALSSEFGENKPSGVSGGRITRRTPKGLSNQDLDGGLSKLIGSSSKDPKSMRGLLATVLSNLVSLSSKKLGGDGSPSGGNGGSSGDTSGDFSGSANAEKAFNYLKSKGLSPQQAAGLVGNFMQEAGVKINPKITNGIGHKGIAQWDPRHRWPQLVEFARSKGLNPETLEAQLQFVWQELSTGSGGLSLGTLKSAKTVAQAAHLFVKNYERSGENPGDAGYDNRIKYGREVFSKYAQASAGGKLMRQPVNLPQTDVYNSFTASQYLSAGGPVPKLAKGGRVSSPSVKNLVSSKNIIPSSGRSSNISPKPVISRPSKTEKLLSPSVSQVVHTTMQDTAPMPVMVPFPVPMQINSPSPAPVGAVLPRKPLYRG